MFELDLNFIERVYLSLSSVRRFMKLEKIIFQLDSVRFKWFVKLEKKIGID